MYEGVPQINKNLYNRLGFTQMFADALKTFGKSGLGTIVDDDEGRREFLFVKGEAEELWILGNIEIPELKHGNDGLIFTPDDESYSDGKRGAILKWKPAR